MALQYQIHKNKDGAVLHLAGRLVAGGGALQLRGLSRQLVNQDIKVDLTDVSSVDAAGLGGFVFLYNQAAACGKRLALVNVSERVSRVLRLTGLSGLLVGPEYAAKPETSALCLGLAAAATPAA